MAETKFVKPKNVNGHFVKIKCKDCGNVQVVFATYAEQQSLNPLEEYLPHQAR